MQGTNEQFGKCAGAAAAGNTLISRLEQRFDSIDFFDMCLVKKVAGIWLARRPSDCFRPHLCRVSPSSDRQWPHKKRALQHLVPQVRVVPLVPARLPEGRQSISADTPKTRGVALCSSRAGRRSCGSASVFIIISLRGQRAFAAA